MSHNALYNFISSEFYQKPADVKLTKNTLSNGKPYYFFSLPNDRVVIGEYTLLSHHLSVNESVINKIDLTSQYHYTAYFMDKSNNEYRLHVYFDANDRIIRRPFFSKVKEDNSFDLVDSSEFDEGFALLAQSATKALVKTVRGAQNAYLTQLKDQSAVLDVKLEDLSAQLTSNKDLYLKTLQHQIELLQRMVSCSNQPSVIQSRIKYYTNLSNSIDLIAERMTQKNDEDKAVPAAVKKEKREDKPNPHSHLPIVTKARVKKSLKEHLNKLHIRVHELLAQADSKLSLKSLNELYDDLVEKEFSIEHGHLTAKVDEIRQLNELRVSIENKGKRLLGNHLLHKEFAKVKELDRFYSTLSNDVLVLGLRTRNTDLLSFLFKENIFSAQAKQLVIDKKEYSSLVDYCFKNHTAETSFVNVLDVLVKHGAPLMDIDESTGLPFIAALFLDKTHPLFEVLKRNMALTLSNALFYKQLSQLLSLLASKSELSTESKDKIAHLLIEFNIRLTELSYAKNLHCKDYAEHQMELMEVSRKSMGDAFLDKILGDSEVKALQETVKRRVDILLPKLSPANRRIVAQYADIDVQQSINALDGLDLSGFESLMSIEQIKKAAIGSFTNAIRIFDLYEMFIDAQNELAVLNRTPRTRLTRDQKRLVTIQKEIIEEIETLSKQWLERRSGANLKERATQIKLLGNGIDELQAGQQGLGDFKKALGNLQEALNQFGFMSPSTQTVEVPSAEEFVEALSEITVPECKPQ